MPPMLCRSSLLFLLLFIIWSRITADDVITTSSDYTITTEDALIMDESTTTESTNGTEKNENEIGDGGTTELLPTLEYQYCPDDFKQLTLDWCFYLEYDPEKRRSMQKAMEFCMGLGAILPAVTSVEVTSALMLERTNRMGISPFESFYIGLGCDTKNHKWMWIDGPEYDPSDAFFSRLTSSEFCSRHDQPFVFNQFGTWSLVDRNYEVGLTVCAKRPMDYSPPNPITAPCTEKWTQLPGGLCYQLNVQLPSPLNIYQAEMACRSIGGHLPSIKSSEQTNLIQTFITTSKHPNVQFWIGLYCKWSEDYFSSNVGHRSWIDGSDYSEDYTNYLDENDDTPDCNINMVDTFIYNGALKGKWQKEVYNSSLNVLMCTRPDPEPAAPTNAPITTKTSTKTTIPTTTIIHVGTTQETYSSQPTTKGDEEEPSGTTESRGSSEKPKEPDITSPTTVFTTIITTVITSSHAPPSTTEGKKEQRPDQLTKLEWILIILLASIILTVLVCLLLYFLCKRIRKGKVQAIVTNMQKRFSRSNTHALVKTDEWEIRRQFVGIDYSRLLGRGAFGSVFLGRVYSSNIPEMAVRTLLQLNSLKKEDDFVAVKTLHETADRQAAVEFMEEINIMKKIGFHERLVNMLACVTETEPLLLIAEYCSNGDLLKFMRERRMFMLKLKDTVGDSIAGRHSVITLKQQIMFAIQIAYGMEYLSQRGFVHRDLAARNILVDQNETCKIGDFGLCRQMGAESEQYISRGGRLPWKWMAPEALERYYFSVESDVWSFGVLLFEIITLGGTPYPDWPAVELLHRLKSGERMPKPDGCSDGFYQVMLGCWRSQPSMRMGFEKLRRKLAHELEECSGDDYYLQLNAGAKYYQETLEYDRIGRFNSF